jgi:UDP-N-acetylmuramoyl-L-alanyl-D-glutamate--2,6-diaminopimelate ligase
LADLLDRMRTDGVKITALEVSSHAIALDRVWELQFSGGIFTNLTRDHLDFHHTMEEYRRVKARFFERLEAGGSFAAVNADDPSADFFVQAARHTRIIPYSVSRSDVDVSLDVVAHSLSGTRGHLIIQGESWPFATTLWGNFNHANLAAMAAGAWATGIEGDQIARGISAFGGIPGRAERIAAKAPFDVFVDYAHTPDALDAVLASVRPLVKGRLLVVFGCGGDRDRGKRTEMARAVERWADRIYLTSDNPRSEDPQDIIAEVKKGFSTGAYVWCDSDRIRAIEQSIADATTGDAVFLCGKGHEETQEVAGVFHPLSDRTTAAQILAAQGHAPQTPEGGGILPGSAVGPGGDPSPTR